MLMAENEIVWGAIVGSGAYGAVSKAKCSREVAVKVVTTRDVNKVRNEVRSCDVYVYLHILGSDDESFKTSEYNRTVRIWNASEFPSFYCNGINGKRNSIQWYALHKIVYLNIIICF